ncbi:unnamed protein product [Heligmosomoides polygyrus]|uniref:Uncharacterized protein n=1 Tax=Heligmosomoides polygyrus TaxID=6339 RepID=A0A183FTI5_HELPZ|nr:unnamed protein product [Heligmosomoides polygyrus]
MPFLARLILLSVLAALVTAQVSFDSSKGEILSLPTRADDEKLNVFRYEPRPIRPVPFRTLPPFNPNIRPFRTLPPFNPRNPRW